jgi:flagella basal body P-ring formation protein FlgA
MYILNPEISYQVASITSYYASRALENGAKIQKFDCQLQLIQLTAFSSLVNRSKKIEDYMALLQKVEKGDVIQAGT